MRKSKRGKKLLRGKVSAILLPHKNRTFCFLVYTDLQDFDLSKERMIDPVTKTLRPLSYPYALFSPLLANITKKAFICPGQGDISVLCDDITGISHLLLVLCVLESVWPFCIFRKGHPWSDFQAERSFVLYTQEPSVLQEHQLLKCLI